MFGVIRVGPTGGLLNSRVVMPPMTGEGAAGDGVVASLPPTAVGCPGWAGPGERARCAAAGWPIAPSVRWSETCVPPTRPRVSGCGAPIAPSERWSDRVACAACACRAASADRAACAACAALALAAALSAAAFAGPAGPPAGPFAGPGAAGLAVLLTPPPAVVGPAGPVPGPGAPLRVAPPETCEAVDCAAAAWAALEAAWAACWAGLGGAGI